jgi:hypothetical protein
MLPLRVKAKPGADAHGSRTIEFSVTATAVDDTTAAPITIIETARFIVP